MSFRGQRSNFQGARNVTEDSVELRAWVLARTVGEAAVLTAVLRRRDRRPRTFPDGRRVRGQLPEEAGAGTSS